MDLFSKCKELYEKIRYFEYGIPVDGVIKPVPSAEYYVKNYRFLKPEEFEKYKGGICWDYVEYERKFLEVNDIDFNQYYLITNTPPNYDTHTFITVKDGDELIYIESSFKRVEHIIDGVQKFKSLEDIVKLITTNMWYCNDNDKHFDEFKYDVCKFKGHPQYGCTCEEYMKWMDDNSDIVIQDVTINPKKVNNDELTVEEFTVNKVDTKFTQFVCESTNDPEEYDETLHDHIKDEDDIYNESWTDFKNGVHPSSGLMFHVSLKNDMDGKTINPQLPSYITDGGKLDDNYQEDTKTKRLCVSPSIEGCLIAILNYNKIREHVGDKFYVYTPEKPFSQYKHKTNKEIVKDKLVFDANITKEAWILEPCKLKLYGIIKLKKVKDLKKKPTVEKNIKMNTIKLDYEWIMTPKVSGKFNKAIGDSPDKEDTKEDNSMKKVDIYNESFKSDMRKKNVQLQRKNKVSEMNEMKQVIRKYVEHDKDGTLVLNAEEIDPKNLPKEIKFTKNLITEIPATTEERAVKWIKRKLENMQFNMDLYNEAEKEFKSTNDYKAKDRMNEYKELLLNDNNFLMNNFNFSAFEFTKPNVKETLMFNQAIRYLAELVNKMNDFNIKSKRQEIASLLGTKYGDDVVIMAKAGKPAITWNNSFSPNFVDIRLSKRANKVYQDADKSMFIHFSKYEGLTELNPGVKSNYGDFTKFGNGKWFYKNPCVHFFAFRMGKFGAHITKQHLKQLMDVYGSHFYVYKPQASDKIYYDVMETGHSSSIHVHGVDAVFIETNKPLPVKEYSVDVFPILNNINRNKNSMITLKESYSDVLISNEEFFMETFKSDMRRKQNESDRVSNVNSLNNFKSIFKDYESIFGHESKFCHSFYAPKNINPDIIKTKKFNINLYTEAYKYLIDLFMKLKNALKQNDVVHSKSLRDKICELTIGTSKSQNALSIGNSEEKISITMMPKSYRKIDTSKYHLFVHRSDNGNLSSLKPSLGKVYDDNNIFMYRSSVVYLFAFEKTNDLDKKKKQFNNFDGFAASSYGDYIYEYKPKSTDVFYIDEHIFERLFKGDRSYIPVNIETKNPLHVTRISVDQVREQLFGNNKITTESSSVLVSNDEFFEEFVSSKQRNREKKFLKERNFVPDKDNPNKGWIDSDFKDENGKPKRIRFEINNDTAIASTNSEDRIQMTRKALRTHPGISSADFKHEEGHMFAKQKYKEWTKSHPKPEDMSLEDHMNEFYKSGEFKDFFARVAKDLEIAVEKGMSEHGKNLEEYFADAFALANSLNESMDIKSIRTMGSRINSNKKYNKLLNRFNENIDNITNDVAKSMISIASNDLKWIKDCPDDIRNNEHFKKLRQAISDCQYYKKLIQIEERTKEFDHGMINIINSDLNDFKSLHDQKSIEAKAKLKRDKEEMIAKLKKQDEKIQSMKAELKIKKKFVEDCKKDIHNLYKASAATNSNLTKMQKEIIDEVKKSQKVLNNEIEFRTKMLKKLSKDEKNQLKIKESSSILISNDEFFDLTE